MSEPRWLAPLIPGPGDRAAYDGSTDSAELHAKRLDAVARAAFGNLRAYSNCCRSTLWALQTHLHLEGPDVLRAASALAGGIAGTGETCGAVIGALMAIGLAIGPQHPTRSDASCRPVAARFVERFTTMFGTTRCYGIQEATLGWRCDAPALVEKWRADGGPIACANVCSEAARIAADLILGESDASSPS